MVAKSCGAAPMSSVVVILKYYQCTGNARGKVLQNLVVQGQLTVAKSCGAAPMSSVVVVAKDDKGTVTL